MKVLCIDSSNPKHQQQLHPEHYIKEGQTYTVCGAYVDSCDRHEYYYLEEKQMAPQASYRANRFIPLFDAVEEDECSLQSTVPAGMVI